MKLRHHWGIESFLLVAAGECYQGYDYSIIKCASIDTPLYDEYSVTLRDLIKLLKDESFMDEYSGEDYLDPCDQRGVHFFTTIAEKLSLPSGDIAAQLILRYLPEDCYSLSEFDCYPIAADFTL